MSASLTHEQRLGSTGIALPAALPAFGQYVPAVLHGDQLWVGGHFGTRDDGSIHTGRCGEGVTTAEARAAARSAALNLVATVRDTLGSLDRVVRVAHVYGVVNATPEFVEHTSVHLGRRVGRMRADMTLNPRTATTAAPSRPTPAVTVQRSRRHRPPARRSSAQRGVGSA